MSIQKMVTTIFVWNSFKWTSKILVRYNSIFLNIHHQFLHQRAPSKKAQSNFYFISKSFCHNICFTIDASNRDNKLFWIFFIDPHNYQNFHHNSLDQYNFFNRSIRHFLKNWNLLLFLCLPKFSHQLFLFHWACKLIVNLAAITLA